MKKFIVILIVLLFVVSVLWFKKDRFFTEAQPIKNVLVNEDTIVHTPLVIENTVTPTLSEHPSWKMYTDEAVGFYIQYPEEITPEVLTEDQVTFQLWGKTQKEDTEFYDGILISIEKKPLGGKTLLSIVTENREGSLEIWGEPVGTIQETTMGEYMGYTYDVSGHTYWFLALNNEYYLEILNMTGDPENVGYKKTAADMLKTFQKRQ